MKQIIIIITFLLLALNILSGLILNCYQIFNMVACSAVILVGGGLSLLLNSIQVKDGFMYSLLILFSIFTFIEFLMALLMPSHINDNVMVIGICGLILLQVIVLLITNITSRKI